MFRRLKTKEIARRALRAECGRLYRIKAFSEALRDLPLSERVKRFPPFCGPKHALKKTLRYDALINRAAEAEGVQKSAVQAVVFRETLGFGVEDLLLDRLLPNASRGLCQIRPSTALWADRILGEKGGNRAEYERLLNRKDCSALCCAKILRALALEIKADPADMTDAQLLTVFKRYNGGSHYARCVLGYCRAFDRVRYRKNAEKENACAAKA